MRSTEREQLLEIYSYTLKKIDNSQSLIQNDIGQQHWIFPANIAVFHQSN